jgi:predicted DNA binding CopG/RHH family protein
MRKIYDDEKELFESVEKGEWGSVDNLDEEIALARETAEATYGKDQRMNIRISSRDMSSLKVRAREEGMPYQTLVSSIIHKYLTGRLVDKG